MTGPLEPGSLYRAIERGAAYLVADLARQPDGLWRDYCRADGSGGSNVWVAAFIAAHVGRIPAARAAAAAVVAALIDGRRPGGGWGYDHQLLPDADSTAWVLLAARATGIVLPRAERIAALQFLLRHQHASGGFVTYGPDGPALFAGTPGRDGWFAPQPCVTAAVLAALADHATPELPAIAAAADYLERAAVGALWHAYWWCGPTYATCVAVRALAGCGRLTDARGAAIDAALRGARNPDGGWAGEHAGESLAFPTALGLASLLALAPRRAPDAALAAAATSLISHQRSSGGFGGSAELRVPGGTSGGTLTMVDRGSFTTACALHALHAYATRLVASKEDMACQASS
jgi:squalene cyclase